MSKVDELMALADEWADECAGCDGSHLAEQSTRRKTLRNALQAALVQSELWQPIETAPRDGRCMLLFYKNRINKTRRVVGSWYTDEAAAQADVDDVGLEAGWYERIDNWDEYPQAAIHEGEPTHWMPLPAEPGAAPPPTHAHDSEPAAYVLVSSYLFNGKAEVSLAFEKPESESYASVIPLYTAQSTQAPPRLAAEQMQSIYKSTHGIGDLERAIESMLKIEAKPKKLLAAVEVLRADIAKLVAYVDERE